MNFPVLDLRAVILLAGAMGALMSVVIWFLRRSYPRSVGGLAYWAAGPALVFLSTLLFGARGVFPELLTVVVANFLLMTGVVTLYIGSRQFYRVPVDLRPWVGAILAITAINAWYVFVTPYYNARLLTVAGFLAVVFLRHALLIGRSGGRAFSARYVLVVLLIEAMVLLLRALSALSRESAHLLEASPIQTLYITAYAVAMLMLTVGLVLLAADRLREELEHIARHDPLTGILTRRALIDTCELELARCRRHDRPMTLLMLDLDHFKAVNDTHGHLMGDTVLLDFVARTDDLLRQVDSFGRYGGEEFVVLLPETDAANALVVAERIRGIAGTTAGLPRYTVSIGVASRRPEDTGVGEMLSRADAALYRAKADGRNCVRADVQA